MGQAKKAPKKIIRKHMERISYLTGKEFID